MPSKAQHSFYTAISSCLSKNMLWSSAVLVHFDKWHQSSQERWRSILESIGHREKWDSLNVSPWGTRIRLKMSPDLEVMHLMPFQASLSSILFYLPAIEQKASLNKEDTECIYVQAKLLFLFQLASLPNIPNFADFLKSYFVLIKCWAKNQKSHG